MLIYLSVATRSGSVSEWVSSFLLYLLFWLSVTGARLYPLLHSSVVSGLRKRGSQITVGSGVSLEAVWCKVMREVMVMTCAMDGSPVSIWNHCTEHLSLPSILLLQYMILRMYCLRTSQLAVAVITQMPPTGRVHRSCWRNRTGQDMKV